MAELQVEDDKRPVGRPRKQVVTSVATKDGGVELGHHGTKTHLPGNLVGLEMELALSLGGVLVKYPNRLPDGKVERASIVVPMNHIRYFKVLE